MADVVTGLDKQDLRILQRIVQRKRGVILAINKWDTVEKDSHTATAYEKEIRAFLRTNDYVPVIFISAQTKQRIYKLMEIAKSVLAEMQKKIPTSELNSRLQADIALRPPSATSGKEIKINYITQIAQNHPVFIFFVNDPRGIDENYSRYLEGKIREHWGFDGAPIALQFRRKN
jgi:GTP-binding protein